jgi:hypothetical protein
LSPLPSQMSPGRPASRSRSNASPAAPVRRDGVTTIEPPRRRTSAATASAIPPRRSRPSRYDRFGPPISTPTTGRGKGECRKPATLGGEPRRRHPMDGAPRQNDTRSAQPVVLRNQQQIEFAASDPRVLYLHCQRQAAARPANRQRRRGRVAAAADDKIRPGRRQPTAIGGDRNERRRPQARRQPRPWPPHHQTFLDERQADRLGEPQRLARHAGLAVMQHPDARRRLGRAALRTQNGHARHPLGLAKPRERNKAAELRNKIARSPRNFYCPVDPTRLPNQKRKCACAGQDSTVSIGTS